MNWIQLVRWICLVVGAILLMIMIYLMIAGKRGSWWLLLAGLFFLGGWFALKPGSKFIGGTGLSSYDHAG